MDKTINENIIKFSGSASLSEGLVTDKSYRVGIEAECYSEEKKSRQDGSFDMHYKLRILGAEVLKDNGEIIHSKDKKTNSQKLRSLIFTKGYDYDDAMPRIMAKIDSILEIIYD